MCTKRRWLISANVAGMLAVVLFVSLAAAQSAPASVLYDQTEKASHASVPSQESPDKPASTTQAADDIVVPAGEHWELSEVEVLGGSPSTNPPSFNVFLYEESNWGPGRELFAERGVSAGGPNYSLPLQGAPLLNPGSYWLSVQAVGPAAEPWTWDTVGTRHGHWAAFWQNPGNALHTDCTVWWTRESCLQGAGQPDQAFKLIGTFEQVLKSGPYGYSGGVTSSPPGISCPTVCATAFDRGTVVTLTGFPLSSDMEFTGWLQNTGPQAPGLPFPQTLDCFGVGPCQLTLNEDLTVNGTYWPASRIRIGKLKHDLSDGAAKLFVMLPAAGVLSISSRGIKAFQEPQARPGALQLPLAPRPWAARKLAWTGKVTVQLRIKFRPFGGTARFVAKALTLRKRIHG